MNDSIPSARRARGRATQGCRALLFSLLFACSSTSFVSTWKAPDAQAIDPRGSKVAAVVMAKSDVMRRAAEDRLAQEITARGAQGVAMYRLAADADAKDEAKVKSLLEREGFKGVVVMRPVSTKDKVSVSTYHDPMYGGYWGGYYGYGWGNSYSTDVRVDTIVSIETLVYSIPENKLLWGGQSKTTNPENIEELVAEVADAAADELQSSGVIAQR